MPGTADTVFQAHIRLDEVCAAAQRVVQLGGEVHGMFSDQTAACALVPHLSGAFLSVAARAGAARIAQERGGDVIGKWQVPMGCCCF